MERLPLILHKFLYFVCTSHKFPFIFLLHSCVILVKAEMSGLFVTDKECQQFPRLQTCVDALPHLACRYQGMIGSWISFSTWLESAELHVLYEEMKWSARVIPYCVVDIIDS